ncbi:MAG TPA: hypothetical protein VFX17_02955 [Patescibacteria group bacterium]|nr:hypothetical protein [Patescibacteria group bacterium]
MKKYSHKIAQIGSVVLGFVVALSPMLAFAQLHLPDAGGTGLSNTFGGATTLSGLILEVINIILALAGLIAVLILIIGGFRYVTSFGNEEAVGKAKKMIINAIIGIIIIILAFVIVRVVTNVFINPSNI